MLNSNYQVDNAEKRLQQTLALLRGYRNSLQRINCLPPEILAMILDRTFPHLPTFIPSFVAYSSMFAYKALWDSWARLIAVCRHWRGIFASFPYLWSTVDTRIMPLQNITRSKSSLLTIFLQNGVPAHILRKIAQRSARFRDLHYVGEPLEPSVGQIFKYPAPNLHSLTYWERGISPSIALTPLFRDQMPNLRQLCLGYVTSWPEGYFKNLTHLCLLSQDFNTRPSLGTFLDFLEGSPNIEQIALVDAGPTGVSSPVPSDRVVRLPHLRQLDLGDWHSAEAISSFLTHLSHSKETKVHIWGAFLAFGEGPSDILPADCASRSDAWANIEEWRFLRTVAPDAPCSFVLISNSTLQLCGSWTETEAVPMASRFPLSHVRKLVYCDNLPDDPPLSADTWREIFRNLPELRRLEIQAGLDTSALMTRNMITALYPDDKGTVLCPHLRSIAIENDLALPHLSVVGCAEKRAQLGYPLKKLRLSFLRDHSRAPSPIGFSYPLQPQARIPSTLGLRKDDKFMEFCRADIPALEKHVEKVKFSLTDEFQLQVVDTSLFTSSLISWTRPEYSIPGKSITSTARS